MSQMLAPWGRVVLAWVCAVTVGCAALGGYKEAPKVSLAGIRVVEAGVLEQKLGLTLRIQNPNEKELPIQAFNFDLLLNGQQFASGVAASAVTVPAFGTNTVEVEAFSSLGSVLKQFAAYRAGGLKKLSYRLKGRAILTDANVRLPFDFDGEIGLPEEAAK
jgi:LEA14-like dessication related protein